MKKNSVLVNQVLMSIVTAGIFSFSFAFTSCSDDDDMLLNGGAPSAETEQDYNGPLQEPLGLSFYDFETTEDVTILNADTTEISVSKALADKLGIQSFLGYPMGIWDNPEHRAYLRRATREKLVGDRYILHVTRSSLAEILAGNDKEIQLSTELYVNTDPASTRTRAIENNTPEYAARYIDEKNVIHPMVVTFKRAEGDQMALTRNAAAEQGVYGTYLPEQLLGIQENGDTRSWGSFWKSVKKVFGTVTDVFQDLAAGTADWFKAQTQELEKWIKEKTNYDIDWDGHNTLMNIESTLEKKIPLQMGEDSKDTINVYVKAPVNFNLNYTLVLQADGNLLETPNLRRFEASVDGRFKFEPEVRIGFDGKLKLPDDKEKIKLVELDGITVVFTIGYVPFSVDFNPSMFLKFKAELGGKATMGVKYEMDSWFKGGILYEGSGNPKGINKSLSAWGVEGRVPFLDKEFLDVAMRTNPEAKMCPGTTMEKKIVREAFAHLLPAEVAWRQKEQFSDGVGYSWIDTLKQMTSEAVSDEQMAHAAERFPINPPKNKEEYYYRSIFAEHFPSDSAAKSVPSEASVACSTAIALEWDAAFKGMNDPSGRAVKGVHEQAY